MATYGHEGGGWMNQDQRDSLAPAKPKEVAPDDLAVDEAWVRSVGFLPNGDIRPAVEFAAKIWDVKESVDFGEHPAMQLVVSTVDCSFWLCAYGTAGQTLTLVEIPGRTRGDLRRLCAALGIKLDG